MGAQFILSRWDQAAAAELAMAIRAAEIVIVVMTGVRVEVAEA
jgi:hypothetical protein